MNTNAIFHTEFYFSKQVLGISKLAKKEKNRQIENKFFFAKLNSKCLATYLTTLLQRADDCPPKNSYLNQIFALYKKQQSCKKLCMYRIKPERILANIIQNNRFCCLKKEVLYQHVDLFLLIIYEFLKPVIYEETCLISAQ